MMQDGMETGVDCGGLVCPPCGIQQGCSVDADCEAAPEDLCCNAGQCCLDFNDCNPTLTCPDGCINGDETDVDCGGATCATRCVQGQRCLIDEDCIEGCVCLDNMGDKSCQCG
jgi:hypothetical protein